MSELQGTTPNEFRLSDGPFFSMEIDGCIHTWNVYKLYEENKNSQIISIEISYLDLNSSWFKEIPTCKDIVPHIERIRDCDFKYPILVTKDLLVVDGLHRIMKAIFVGKSSIDAIVVELKDPYSVRHL